MLRWLLMMTIPTTLGREPTQKLKTRKKEVPNTRNQKRKRTIHHCLMGNLHLTTKATIPLLFLLQSFTISSHYLSISFNIFQYLSISFNIFQYLSISFNIFQYLSISFNIFQYLPFNIFLLIFALPSLLCHLFSISSFSLSILTCTPTEPEIMKDTSDNIINNDTNNNNNIYEDETNNQNSTTTTTGSKFKYSYSLKTKNFSFGHKRGGWR